MIKEDFKKSAARGVKKEQTAGAARNGSGIGAGASAGISRQMQPQGPTPPAPRGPMPKGAFVMPVTSFATGAKLPLSATSPRSEKTETGAAKDTK